MRILVTGGAGFIGSHIVESLVADGHEVAVIDDLSTGRRENVPDDVRLMQFDLRDDAATRAAVTDFRPQVVSHQAAQVSVSASVRQPAEDASINIMGGLALLDACVAARVERVIFASTGGALYGHIPEPEVAGIDRPINPASPYAVSKAAFEAYLHNYQLHTGLGFLSLRYANVYGPRQDPHGEAGVISIFCERLLAGQGVTVFARREPGDGGCVRDYTHVDDVVAAHRAAVSGELAGPVVNVGTGTPTTTAELLELIAATIGVTPVVEQAPPRPGDVERSVLRPGPGVTPTMSLADGLALTVAWFRKRAAGSAE